MHQIETKKNAKIPNIATKEFIPDQLSLTTYYDRDLTQGKKKTQQHQGNTH